MQAFETSEDQHRGVLEAYKVRLSGLFIGRDLIFTDYTSDMNHYFKFIQSLKNNDLLLYFKAFRELAQIYLIDPSDAKELATIIADADRFSGIWRVEEVYEFAERRADWFHVKRDVERAMYGIGCNVM
jgi:recyclin-1